jgi:hypothetical protein
VITIWRGPPVGGVGLPAHPPGGLDAVDEAARRRRAQHHLAGELVDAQPPLRLATEGPEQVTVVLPYRSCRAMSADDRPRPIY